MRVSPSLPPTVGALLLGLLAFSLPASSQDSDRSDCEGSPLGRGSYVSTWEGLYPNSASLDHVVNGTGKSCQFCHQSINGGEPYNAYGWGIKLGLDGGMTLAQSILAIEPADSDADPTGSSNLAEITSGVQPGWRAGGQNTIYFKDGLTQTGQSAPAAILGPDDPISHPSLVVNGTGVNPVILADAAGDPAVSPKIGSTTERFAFSLDCGGSLAPSFYAILVQASFLPSPRLTKFGELFGMNPTYIKLQGMHSQNQVATTPMTVPYDLSFVGRSYVVQGYCGDPVGGGYVSNALGQTIGI